jgi:hypothetical protein
MLSLYAECHAECRKEAQYDDCHYAECCKETHCADCLYAECRKEAHNAVCRDAECLSTQIMPKNVLWNRP